MDKKKMIVYMSLVIGTFVVIAGLVLIAENSLREKTKGHKEAQKIYDEQLGITTQIESRVKKVRNLNYLKKKKNKEKKKTNERFIKEIRGIFIMGFSFVCLLLFFFVLVFFFFFVFQNFFFHLWKLCIVYWKYFITKMNFTKLFLLGPFKVSIKQKASSLNRGLSSNFWLLRRANYRKFTEKYIFIKKNVLK